jgi:hypothetical protein
MAARRVTKTRRAAGRRVKGAVLVRDTLLVVYVRDCMMLGKLFFCKKLLFADCKRTQGDCARGRRRMSGTAIGGLKLL